MTNSPRLTKDESVVLGTIDEHIHLMFDALTILTGDGCVRHSIADVIASGNDEAPGELREFAETVANFLEYTAREAESVSRALTLLNHGRETGSSWSGWQPPETAPKDGKVFEITTAGPNRDLCWWDDTSKNDPCFRDYSFKQRIKPKWPYMVAWRKLAPDAFVCNTEAESRRSNGFPPRT